MSEYNTQGDEKKLAQSPIRRTHIILFIIHYLGKTQLEEVNKIII